METAKKSAEQLREQIFKTEQELNALREQLAEVEKQSSVTPEGKENGIPTWKWPLTAEEYDRYGRQLILPNVGIHGQQRLKSSKVLIIGAGGLGCPSAAYIAGAGIGTLGIVDGDVVEPSNLHRQIAHGSSRVGMFKVDSLVAYCKELNPLPTYVPHREHLTPQNAEDIVSQYDLVLDCTDHPTSRYLINDICILLRKPLVSASALRTDGQLIVLNSPPTPQGTVSPESPPCYRCVFPKPPPPESVVSCGEGGILGPVVGVMGILQALEAIKIISAGLHVSSPASDDAGKKMASPTLLLFSGGAVGAPSFRSVRMRGRRKDCFACGEGAEARLTLETLRGGGLDYVAFCGGMSAPVKLLGDEERVSAREYHDQVLKSGDGSLKKGWLLDVREKELFDICHIDGAANVPYSRIQSSSRSRRPDQEDGTAAPDWIPSDLAEDAPIYVVCRLGHDSQLVAKQLKDLGHDKNRQRFIGDIKGGMRAWKTEVDETLPFM
ncbi:Adenylyltransferase and sulfurtransferase uba4 [Cytospora mali]|uniref:Adenylyltransferase and sulfurtransferase uba4 n=1 Tax=Cytospora mali TaxID=578113 RepID=A0A194VAF9_CYTMA|nr:Adenylyltransferase and sulfurtransferase uba4 [Valsa mali var. pyri (nom. inval.)]